jgi:sortase A
LLTLTTCNPKYSAKTRLIVHAILESALLKTNGDPPALTGKG